MIITKMAIPRRTVLRGIGASLALPFLDSMVPAATAMAKSAAKPVYRFGAFYNPCGMAMKYWTPPASEGQELQLSHILEPLAKYRDNMMIVQGLNSKGGHSQASTGFLTGMNVPRSEIIIKADVSADQVIAQQFGKVTQLRSLECGIDSRDTVGTCDAGYACAYVNAVAWRNQNTPLMAENNPRAVFELLFGDSGSTDASARLARAEEQKSVLDSVNEKVAAMARTLGPKDRARLDEYTESIRDVERRIQKTEEQASTELPVFDQPSGIPLTYPEHVKLMMDLQVLAHQSDLTRVSTMMMAREITGRTYPEIGITDGHHPTSHHQNDPVRYEKIHKINVLQTTLFSYFLDRLQSVPDGDGTLLDHIALMYGAGMADSDQHSPVNVPILLVGGGVREKMGRNLVFKAQPNTNLLLTLINKFVDEPMASFSDSTGPLDLS
jgi:hypothetical protein